MKCRIISDLHLEGYDWTYKSCGEDVLILAGDVCSLTGVGMHRRANLLNSIKVPVIYTPGNHEFYGERNTHEDSMKMHRYQVSAFRNVHLLDNEEVTIDGVRFLAATLWSDMKPKDTMRVPFAQADLERFIENGITDFAFMLRPDKSSTLRASDMAGWHNKSAEWLYEQVRKDTKTKTVVVTHFMPSPKSIDPMYAGQPLNAYFCANVEHIMGPPVSLWVHGHTHSCADYVFNQTRVVCNPRGYAREKSGYDSNLVIEI